MLAGTLNSALADGSNRLFISEWGQSGTGEPGSFLNPQNLAIDSDGNVYVTDLGGKRIQKFDNDGTFLMTWGSGGDGAGQFKAPSGITVFENFVYVVDSQLHNVQKFDTDGNFLARWGSLGNDPGKFQLPNGITANADGTIFVVDTGNSRLQQFSPDGEFIKAIGESGTLDDQFVSPKGIHIDNLGNIYVTDPGNMAIKKFNSDGIFEKIYDSNIGGLPIKGNGLTTDSNGNIYVVDSFHDRIVVLDSKGIAISVWGSMGIQPEQFKFPKDIALDDDGDLFIVDSNGHRIQKFETQFANEEDESELVSQETESISDITQETEQISETKSTYSFSSNPVISIPGDFVKPLISTPNNLIIEATGILTPVSIGQALATDASGIQSLAHNGRRLGVQGQADHRHDG